VLGNKFNMTLADIKDVGVALVDAIELKLRRKKEIDLHVTTNETDCNNKVLERFKNQTHKAVYAVTPAAEVLNMSCQLVDNVPEYGVVVKADLPDGQLQDLAENVSDAFATKLFDTRRLLALDGHEAMWLRRLASVGVSASFGAQGISQQSNSAGTVASGTTMAGTGKATTATTGVAGTTVAASAALPKVTATVSVTVGSCSEAQNMASSNAASAAFRKALANSINGIAVGDVGVNLTAACRRRLVQEVEAALRRLASTLRADYTITVPSGTQASAVESSVAQNTMPSTLTAALDTPLDSTPFAHVSVNVTAITKIVAITPSGGTAMTAQPAGVNAAVRLQGALVKLSALLLGLLW